MPLLVAALALLLAPASLRVPVSPVDPVIVSGLDRAVLDRLTGVVPGDGSSILSVRVASASPIPAMLGSWSVEASTLTFRPRLPFVPGVTYTAAFHFEDLRLEAPFRIEPEAPPAAAGVIGVHPAGDVLPENLLRFYVFFSRPMLGGDVDASIHLENGDGGRIDQAFVETPELWDPEKRRLTLICHPGRLKRGLEMRDRAGTPMRDGGTYRLVIEAGMMAADGGVTGAFVKTFQAGAPDRRSSLPAEWILHAPAAGSRDPLRIELDEPLDPALLSRLLAVEGEDGSIVAGLVDAADPRVCLFAPDELWRPGAYRLSFHPAIEDLAGNRLDRLFDQQPAPEATAVSAWKLPFEIGNETAR